MRINPDTTPNRELALKRAQVLIEAYENRLPKAISTLEAGLEDSLSYLAFPSLDARKISSNNLIERLNKEIRRRTNVIGIFPNPESYVRLITVSLMEYAEDWSASKAYLSQKSIEDIPTLTAA
ncbi:hypothetical protein HCH52_11790 [Oscillospiraceae bacterium HV4-5-C5C]|nr:hypothetical protein [Oscillospiraceae bacterium HV4-5-C5C]